MPGFTEFIKSDIDIKAKENIKVEKSLLNQDTGEETNRFETLSYPSQYESACENIPSKKRGYQDEQQIYVKTENDPNFEVCFEDVNENLNLTNESLSIDSFLDQPHLNEVPLEVDKNKEFNQTSFIPAEYLGVIGKSNYTCIEQAKPVIDLLSFDSDEKQLMAKLLTIKVENSSESICL